MKLSNSTIVAIVAAAGFSLTAYVMGQGHGQGPATTGPASGLNPGQSMQGTQGQNLQPAPQTTIGPTSGARPDTTVGPVSGAQPDTTVGPVSGARPDTTVGPVSGARPDTTVGPTSGTAKSKSSARQTKSKQLAVPTATMSPKTTAPPTGSP